MRSSRMMRLCVLVALAVSSNAAAETRESTSIERVASAYERADEALANLKDASKSGGSEETKDALIFYLRSLSQFHITLAKQRVGQQERAFLKTLAPRLALQLRATKALAEIAQPELHAALNEAMNHQTSTLELVEHIVNRKSGPSVQLSILGPESTNPGARSWPPYLLFGGTKPQFRIR